jgi:hypothetical protein
MQIGITARSQQTDITANKRQIGITASKRQTGIIASRRQKGINASGKQIGTVQYKNEANKGVKISRRNIRITACSAQTSRIANGVRSHAPSIQSHRGTKVV